MNQRFKGISTGASGQSSNRQEISRTNMVSPNRNNNEKSSTSSNARFLESQGSNSQKMIVTKNPSISLKPGEKKQPTTPSLSSSKIPAQINVNNINLADIKKTVQTLPSDTQIQNIDGAPLQQLDLASYTQNQIKNDSNLTADNTSGTKNVFTYQNSTAANSNNSTQQLAVKKVASNIQQPLTTSYNMNQSAKTPNKTYLSSTPNSLAVKKDQQNLNPSGNLVSSINLGNALSANNPTSINMSAINGQVDMKYNAADVYSPQAGDSSQVNFEVLKQFDQKQKAIRPLNKMEIEFNENGMGNENLRFQDQKSVCVMPEKSIYTLDKVYPPDTQQEQIYEDVGREMVNDVLQGYNGTIFAYGPTGSGKTYTMFGDVTDLKNKGIIPRVSNQIFTHINAVDSDVEFIITVSMLEIYKEQLFDLLKVDRVGLKIKENPQKGGIYVQGLTTISVDCEEEILDAINLGYQSKQTRETRMNEYSSRSHTIFTINVTQRYPNGQEKIGKLNLVDLAGSEKIAKTQATGETLEEAKKINLSLSCLGNVIHALTQNQEHIPYRDSKLTRILQESLGGNYKTSLVAAISPHSSQHEEQVSTLKFATRAKTIKNHVKMNVKLSVEQMRKLIEQLKAELEKAQVQNNRFKDVIKKLRDQLKLNQQQLIQSSKDGRVSEQQQQAIQNTVKALEDILNSSDIADQMEETVNGNQANAKSNYSKSYEDSELDESTTNNNNVLQNDANDGKIPSQFSGKRSGSNQKDAQNAQQAGAAGQKGQPVNLDYKVAYQEKVSQCRNLEKEIMELKRIQLETERSLADVREEKHKLEYNHTQQITKNDYNRFEIEILHKQIQSLVDSICKSENTIGTLMKEKQEISQKKVEDFLKDKLTFSEIHFSEYFKKSINFNYDNLVQKWADVQKNMKMIGVDDQELFKSQAEFQVLDNDRFNLQRDSNINSKPVEELIRGSFIGNLDFNQVSNPYSVLEEIVEFPGQLEKLNSQTPISRDLMIILLKKQLFNSHQINQHLARTINALEWKQIIEYGKAKMKSILNKIQTKHINKLEQVINEASKNYRQLRNRIEEVELETQFVKEKIGTYQDFAPKKSKIIKDTESIRNLLMKPSNDTIRKSLRGSFIGFQLDLDKTVESPVMKELKEADELISKDLIPLTYDRAVEELKQRNSLIRKSYQELKGNFFNGINQEFVEQVLKEKERLEGRINILQNELKMESSKSEHYTDAYKAEKQNFQLQRDQTKELELFLVNKMKEESELMEKTQRKINDSHEKEILKYQQSFMRLSDRFAEYIKISIQRLQDMKSKPGQVTPQQIESLYSDIIKVKEQYNKIFNPDSTAANGSESPSNVAGGMRFNPNSMIFKSFEAGSEGIVFPPSFTGNQAIKIDDENINKVVVNRASIELGEEARDSVLNEHVKHSQFTAIPTLPHNNLNDLNQKSYASNNVKPATNPTSPNQQIQTQTQQQQQQQLQQQSSPKPQYVSNFTSYTSYSKGMNKYGGGSGPGSSYQSPSNNLGGHTSPSYSNNVAGHTSPSYSNNLAGHTSPSSNSIANASNAVNNSSRSKLNSNTSSTTNSTKTSGTGLFGYRKY